MTNLLNHPLYCFSEMQNHTFQVSAIDYQTNTVTVVGTEIKQDDLIVDRILRSFDIYEVKLLLPTGRTDDENRELIDGDIVAYGERFEYVGFIYWNDQKLTWEIENTQGNDVEKFMLLSDVQRDLIHIIDSKYKREL